MHKKRSINFAIIAVPPQCDTVQTCKIKFNLDLEMKEFENYIVLAIEHAKGGTLTDIIKNRHSSGNPLTEEECA